MNLIEHYIVEVHIIKDITDEFIKHCGYVPKEPLLEIDMTYNCYGIIERRKQRFWKSDYDIANKQGYFLA